MQPVAMQQPVNAAQIGAPIGVPVSFPVVGPNAAGCQPVMVVPPQPVLMGRAPTYQTQQTSAASGVAVDTKDLEGCWVTPACGGLYCYGLQAYGPDALLGNPVPCCCGLPWCAAWGLGTCGVPVFVRDNAHPEVFRNQSEGQFFKILAKDRMSSNLCSIEGLGRPISLKMFPLPQCCFSCRTCCCAGCEVYG